jgi:hypothetical protein
MGSTCTALPCRGCRGWRTRTRRLASSSWRSAFAPPPPTWCCTARRPPSGSYTPSRVTLLYKTTGSRPVVVYRFPRRALTLCPQLCMGIQPGAHFPAPTADALSATLYGHFTQAIYRNRIVLKVDAVSSQGGGLEDAASVCRHTGTQMQAVKERVARLRWWDDRGGANGAADRGGGEVG